MGQIFADQRSEFTQPATCTHGPVHCTAPLQSRTRHMATQPATYMHCPVHRPVPMIGGDTVENKRFKQKKAMQGYCMAY
jgi:hypothetical protein